MLKFSEKDIQFVKNNLSKEEQEKILTAQTLEEALDVFSSWIDLCEDCWEEDGINYSDLGRQAQRIYDNIYLNN